MARLKKRLGTPVLSLYKSESDVLARVHMFNYYRGGAQSQHGLTPAPVVRTFSGDE